MAKRRKAMVVGDCDNSCAAASAPGTSRAGSRIRRQTTIDAKGPPDSAGKAPGSATSQLFFKHSLTH